ncbi:MAG: molybdopterin-dependent oxidoreductase, partial [Candidatus Eisenbacteria bacterium]|nr:molybdopterin-dependent oxidoreductase [Candidatus Eisenbacteria bacterium]
MPDTKITLNGKEVEVPSGLTILEAARREGVEIPTLCHDDKLEPYASCWLCAVKIEGLNRYVPSCGTTVAPGMKVWTDTEDVRAVRRMALELLLSNHRGDCVAPCKATCPAGVDVQGYIALIADRKYSEATALVKEVNPFPLAIGRVCTRPCEAECRRNAIDGPVAIDYLKRFAADRDAERSDPWCPAVAPSTGKKVALVGAGPASMTAAFYLRQMGHECVVFEALPKAGGMLRYGIPEYRLPKATLDTEIDLITRTGIDVEYGQALGCDFTLADLFGKGFDAVFLGLGAMGSRSMRAPGEDLAGVWAGTEFLKKMGLGEAVEIGKKVAVIGGGNTAVDAARTALRLGADKVTIVYRRSREEMPAWDVEVEAALEEGVEMHFLASPTRIEGEGCCQRMEYIEMELGEPDDSGRRRPVPIEGSEKTIEVDNVIAAIGQVPALDCIHETASADEKSLEAKLELTRWGTIVADEATGATTVERVFAGGDVVRGAATAIEAIADGGKAARAIGRLLAGEDVDAVEPFFNITKERWDAFPEEELEDHERRERVEMSELPVRERVTSFDEVELGLSEEQALEESKRCLECGCISAFECRLRQYSAEYGAEAGCFGGEVVSDPPDERHPFIRLEPEKCILCARCIRVCDEVEGARALGLFRRGFDAQMKPALDRALAETTCEACGQCVASCPTAAISLHTELPKPGPWDLEAIDSTCTFCGTGCSIALEVRADELVKVCPGGGETGGGNLCVRGRFGLTTALAEEPLGPEIMLAGVKAGEKKAAATLEEAVAAAAEGLKPHIGDGTAAVLGGARLTNEEAYLLQRVGRVELGTPYVGSLGLERERAVLGAMRRAFGREASTATYDDLRVADVILVFDSDIAEEQTVAGLEVRKAVRRGARLIVVAPEKTRMAALADTWISVSRSDYGRVMGEMLEVLAPGGKVPEGLPYEIEGLEELRASLTATAAAGAESNPGEQCTEAARAFAGASKGVLVANAMSFDAQTAGRDPSLAVALAAVAGKARGPAGGILLLRMRANGQGLTDAGLSPDLLPGQADARDDAARKALGRLYGRDVPSPPDESLWDAIASGRVRAALIVGEDPVGGSSDPEATAEALKKLDFLVVADSLPTATSELADVVLPLNVSACESGSFTNSESRVQQVVGALTPRSGVSNLELISGLAGALGGEVGATEPAKVREELEKASSSVAIEEGEPPSSAGA